MTTSFAWRLRMTNAQDDTTDVLGTAAILVSQSIPQPPRQALDLAARLGRCTFILLPRQIRELATQAVPVLEPVARQMTFGDSGTNRTPRLALVRAIAKPAALGVLGKVGERRI